MNKVAVRTIPERLMPDANYQFLICKPFELVFDPDKPLPADLFNPTHGDLVPPEPDQWFLYDSWSIDLACKLITLGYPVHLEGMAEEVKGWPQDCEGRDRFNTMVWVYDRALSIAKSSVQAGKIKEHDTPAKWIEWAKSKGYRVAHLLPADAPGAKGEADTSPSGDERPWLIAAPNDPAPDYPWYTPARYFARQLVVNDSTLLLKREKLADKTAKSLAGVGVFKRGKKKLPLSAGTVLKSFVNVTLN